MARVERVAASRSLACFNQQAALQGYSAFTRPSRANLFSNLCSIFKASDVVPDCGSNKSSELARVERDGLPVAFTIYLNII